MTVDQIFWLGAFVVFLAIETGTLGLVSIWFAAGALAAMVVSLTGGGIGFQTFVFLAVSVVLLTALRPLLRKYITPKLTKTNIDSVIGSTGYVTVPINNVTAEGQVKLGAMYWTARSTSGEPIPEGTLIRADRIEGVKVFVSPADVPAQV